MKELIEEFKNAQIEKYGYEQFKIRGKKDEYFVDIYTRHGLLIKSILNFSSESKTKEFIEAKLILLKEGV